MGKAVLMLKGFNLCFYFLERLMFLENKSNKLLILMKRTMCEGLFEIFFCIL